MMMMRWSGIVLYFCAPFSKFFSVCVWENMWILCNQLIIICMWKQKKGPFFIITIIIMIMLMLCIAMLKERRRYNEIKSTNWHRKGWWKHTARKNMSTLRMKSLRVSIAYCHVFLWWHYPLITICITQTHAHSYGI